MSEYTKKALKVQIQLCSKNIANIREVIAKEMASKRELTGLLYASEGPDVKLIHERIMDKEANIEELEKGARAEETKQQEYIALLDDVEE